MNLTLDDMREILGIYGEVPAAPAGYELTGEFKSPSDRDIWLMVSGEPNAQLISKPYPRLILRKLPEPELVYTVSVSTKDVYPKGYEIPEGYESLGFGLRHPEATDYLDVYGCRCSVAQKSPHAVRILLKKKA